MNRRLKVLGIALVATLALLAGVASIASAQFTSNKSHTIISGIQSLSHVFTAGSGFGGISCWPVHFSGTAASGSESTMVLTPTYGNCKDSFGRTVDVDNSSLTYTFTSGAWKGAVDVSGGMTLTVTSGGSVVCTMVIKAPQTNFGVSYTNGGGSNPILMRINITNLQNTTSGGFFNCGVSNGEHFLGTYEGDTWITGSGTEGSNAAVSVD